MSERETKAEQSVLAHCLSSVQSIVEVVGDGLTPEDFASPAARELWVSLVAQWESGGATDALTVGTLAASRLAPLWNVSEGDAVDRVRKLAASTAFGGTGRDHAALVMRLARGRRLVELADRIKTSVAEDTLPPEDLAGIVSEEATQIATGVSGSEVVSFADVGRNFVAEAQRSMAATRAGARLGVRTGVHAIDAQTSGLQPTELMILGGPPGAGKSILGWSCGMNFARDQALRPKDQQVGTLMLSLEMGEKPSSGRIAQMLTGIPSSVIRDGSMSDKNLKYVVERWSREQNIPLYFNYMNSARSTRLKGVIAEAIRKYNVGFVVIDHFRMFRPDHFIRNQVEEDEEKALFLKESIAMSMNVAVMCLAHTRKLSEPGRPRLSDLRGSGQIAAHADFVGFLHRPASDASDDEIKAGRVDPNFAEFGFEKNRHNAGDWQEIQFDMDRLSAS